jgi:GT2 family glycosyltransferase
MAALRVIAQGSPAIGFDPDDIAVHLPSDVQLEPSAPDEIMAAMAEYPQAVAIYWDIMVDGQRQARPAWSPTKVQSEPGACLPLAVRASWPHFDPSRNPLEVERRLAESNAVVLHVPSVLTVHPAPTAFELDPLADDPQYEPGTRPGTRRRRPTLPDQARTSIIIPSAGISQPGSATSMLARCLETLTLLDPAPLEAIVVVGDEFQGDLPVEQGPQDNGLAVQVVHRGTGAFDFSQAANRGLKACRGEFVLLLNDDIEAETSDWLGRMAAHLQDPEVGAVGAALLYPNRTVQHVGVLIDDAYPLHPFVGYRLPDTAAHGGDVARDMIAVTGACLLARRQDLMAVGGLSPDFPSSYGDIDLCLRLRRSGLRVVIEPAAVLIHLETASRPPVIEPWEKERFERAWGHVADPWYHPAFYRPCDPRNMNRNANHLAPIDQYGTWPVRTSAIEGQNHPPPMNRPDSSEFDSEMSASDDTDITRVQAEIEVEADVRRRRDPQVAHREHDIEQQWGNLVLPEPAIPERDSPDDPNNETSADHSPPSRSNLISRLFKRGLRRITRRYTHHVLAQVDSLLKVIRQRLDDQQEHTEHHSMRLDNQNRHLRVLENTMYNSEDNPYLITSHLVDPPPALAMGTVSTIATLIESGPSLVLSAGAGDIVKAINTNSGSAYGLESDALCVLRAMQDDLDVRSDDFLEHLLRLNVGEVSTIVLTGMVEFLPFKQLLAIVEQAERILTISGHVIVAVADPQNRNHIESEIRAGFGMAPATWQYLLDRAGFDTFLEPIDDPRITELVVAKRPQQAASPELSNP